MVFIGRPINGITLNPLEYLLDDGGDVMEFDTEEAAKAFLKDKGLTDDELDLLVFRERSPEETAEYELSDNRIPLGPPTKAQFIDAYSAICTTEDLFTEAENLFGKIPPTVQTAILNYHNARGTLQHALRWGLQAAKELREDWHTVVAGLPCGE